VARCDTRVLSGQYDTAGSGDAPPEDLKAKDLGWAAAATCSSSPALPRKISPVPAPANALPHSPPPSFTRDACDVRADTGVTGEEEEEEEEEERVVSEALVKAESEVRGTVERALQEVRDGEGRGKAEALASSAHHLPAALRARLEEALLKILESLHTPRSKDTEDASAEDAGEPRADAACVAIAASAASARLDEAAGAGVGSGGHSRVASRGEGAAERRRGSRDNAATMSESEGPVRTNFMTFAQYKKMAGPHATTAQWKQYTGQLSRRLAANSASPGATDAAGLSCPPASCPPASAAVRSTSSAAAGDNGAAVDIEVLGGGGGGEAVAGERGGATTQGRAMSAEEERFYQALMALDHQVAHLRRWNRQLQVPLCQPSWCCCLSRASPRSARLGIPLQLPSSTPLFHSPLPLPSSTPLFNS